MLTNIAAAFLLAVFVEGVIEYFVPKSDTPREWVKYVAALLGVAISIAYKVDILASLGVISAYPLVGEIVTGLIIGRGSNYLNQFLGKVGGSSTKVEVPSNTTSSVNVETKSE